jgi:hypothetical protein
MKSAQQSLQPRITLPPMSKPTSFIFEDPENPG